MNLTIDRTDWPAGPWDNEPDQSTWTDPATGLTCVALRRPRGHWCGYVGLPKTHPLHGKDDPPELDVHGGISFTDHLKDQDPDLWWIGFDCCHAWDFSPSDLLYAARWGGSLFAVCETAQYRTLEYVKAECARLAKQLAGVV